MSIADKITQLTNIRAAIRTALQNKGIAAAVSHNFADFAADIAAIATGANLQAKSVSPSTSQQVVSPDSGYDGLSSVTVAGAPLQTRTVTPTAAGLTVEKSSSSWYGLFRVNVNGDSNLVAGNIKSGVSIFGVAGSYAPSVVTQEKSVTPTASQQVVTPDSGKLLSKVTVAATPLETRAVTPSASAQTITPSSGKVGISQVDVAAAPLETKTVTPTAADQIISPSSGKIGMSQVTVKAAPLQTKTVTPSGSQQVITPGSGYVGMSKVTVKAAVLQAKSVTPSSSQQVITPDSGKYGLSQVTVAAVTPVPINGSLIECTCSSDITSVSTTINGTTYSAYLNTSTHKAYITIPYTITSGTITVNGYAGSTLATSASVVLNGIDKYTCILTTSAVLYDNGSWVGLASHGWTSTPQYGSIDVAVTENSSNLSFAFESAGNNLQTSAALTPKISSGGHTKIKITAGTVTSPNKIYAYVASSTGAVYGGTGEITSNSSTTIDIPSNLVNSTFYLIFWCKCNSTTTRQVARITKIEFV